MKLSDYKNVELSKNIVDEIVFSNIEDTGEFCYYALVFGHAMLIVERTLKAVEMYKQKRVKKLVFMGGGYGDSNVSKDHIPEAHKMRELAIKNGVNPDDIIVEDKSRNTKENILFALDLLDKSNFDKVMLITSEFHLKRCNALIKKIIPGVSTILVKAPDGIHDRDNWFMSDNIGDNNGKHGSGKSLVENEARILIEGACNGTLENFEVNNRPYNYNLRIINK